MHQVVQKMIELMPTFTRAEKKIAEALMENPEAVERMTLSKIALNSDSSEATFIRFCRKLGYEGFSDFKAHFSEENRLDPVKGSVITDRDDIDTILRELYKDTLEILSDLLAIRTNAYDRVLEAMLSANEIHFFAVGDASMAARLTSMKLRRLGVRCLAEEDVVSQMISSSNLSPGDLAIAVSYEGRTRSVVEAMRIAKSRGATTVSITRKDESPLMEYTDITLLIPSRDLTVGRDKVTRRISDQLILEALYLGYEARTTANVGEKIRLTQDAIDTIKI